MAVRAIVEKGRATLHKAMVEIFGDPVREEDVIVWLFVLDPGHLRVLSEQAKTDVFSSHGFATDDAIGLEVREERERLAALRIRLIQTSIVWKWRLRIPSEIFELCEEDLDRTRVWIDQGSSWLDVYTATYVQKLMRISPSKLLPKAFNPE